MTVNMDGDYEDLYSDLNSLLKDICRFLETNCLHLSTADKKKADELIERSKQQLQVIDKLSTGHENGGSDILKLQETAEISDRNGNERYVDMTKKIVPPPRPPIVEPPLYQSKCPFQDLPAKEASQEIKYGTLSKRRKVLNIIDVSTKVYAVIQENWLLVYNSRKDLKPDCTFDLKQYEAKEDETDQGLSQFETTKEKNAFSVKMTSSFKVFHSLSAEKKSYSFIATTHKDMLQWVVNINRRHDKAVLPTKQTQDEPEQNYEICQDFHDLIEEENIYNEIEMPCRRPVSIKMPKKDDRPAVPEKRPPVPNKNVSHPPSISTSTESMALYEELEQKASSQKVSDKCSLTSFETSGDEEDQAYYELDTIIKEVKVKQDLENNKFTVDVHPPSLRSMEGVKTLDANESGHTLRKKQEDDVNNEPPSLDNKLPVQSNDKSTATPSLPKKAIAKPLAPKPKILSPKPWKSFKKNMPSKTSRSPQVSKNKPIRESLKSPPKLEKQSSLEESSCQDLSPAKSSVSCNSDSSNTSNDISPLKQHQGSSIVKILRNRWSTSQSPSCSLETFSRNSKIETFQASPIKETPSTDFLRSPSNDLTSSVLPIDTLIPDLTKNGKDEDEKPMVLLKPSLENEDGSEKLKKSPVVPLKPKKVAKKLAL